jgi:pseudouridine synthase
MIENDGDLRWWTRRRKMMLGGARGAGGTSANRARDPTPAVWMSTILLALLLLGLLSLHVVDSFSVKTTTSKSRLRFLQTGSENTSRQGHLQLQLQHQDQEQQPERTVVLAYHKPSGVVTTHADDDELGRPNVYNEIFTMKGYKRCCDDGDDDTSNDNDNDNTDSTRSDLLVQDTDVNPHPALPSPRIDLLSFEQVTHMRTRLHAIGRLDADTTGLLLLTNDGGLVHHATAKDATTHTHTAGSSGSSSNSNSNSNSQAAASGSVSGPITKTYQAVIMGYHEQDSDLLQGMRLSGVDIGAKYGGWTLPVDDLTVLGHATAKSTTVSLTICQGKNRQIRRMFHAVGSGVMKLQRTHIGRQLSLDGLEEGEWRILSHQEVINGLQWTPRVLVDPAASSSSKNNISKNKSRGKRADTPRPKPGRRRRRGS